VFVPSNVSPSKVVFTNAAATAYAFSGTGGIVGMTGVTKTGNGMVTFSTPNQYTGPTAVQAGTLVLDHSSAVPLATANPISVSAGAAVRFYSQWGRVQPRQSDLRHRPRGRGPRDRRRQRGKPRYRHGDLEHQRLSPAR
jgi:autotransporter-associated beta strand protein